MTWRERFGVSLIGLMCTFTLLGSISGLIHYAQEGKPGGLPIGNITVPSGILAFVAGLDGLAVALTLLAHRDGRTDWPTFAGLMLVTAASTALQVAAVWSDGWTARIVHGSPAPCTAVAAFFLLHSLDKQGAALPPPPAVHVPGGINADASAPGPEAQGPPPAPEVPPAAADPQRRRSSAQRGTGGAGGRTSKVEGEELIRRTAVWLTEHEMSLSARSVETAVKSVRGSCGRALRDQVYAALSEPDALGIWAETSATGDAKESD